MNNVKAINRDLHERRFFHHCLQVAVWQQVTRHQTPMGLLFIGSVQIPVPAECVVVVSAGPGTILQPIRREHTFVGTFK